MGLDRRVVVKIEAEGTRDGQGNYVPGPVTDYPRWAEQRSAGSVDVETVGGVRIVASRTFTVRDFVELRHAGVSFVSVADENGDSWNAENVTLSDARRRFITIETTRTT